MTFPALKPLALCLVLVVGLPIEGRLQESPQLVIGVRSEARPFSHRLTGSTVESDATRGPLSHAGYGGYMIRICDAVLAEMLVNTGRRPQLTLDDVAIHDIDAEYLKAREDYDKATVAPSNPKVDRLQPSAEADDQQTGMPTSLRPDDRATLPSSSRKPEEPPIPSEWRFAYLGEKFDILCDPATITNEHRTVTVSPPVFLGGIGYLKLRDAPLPDDPCGTRNDATGNPVPALIGLVGGTTAATRGLQALIAARELPKFEDKLIAYLRLPPSDQIKQESGPCKTGRVLVKAYLNHQEAARQFCRGTSFHYYVGDLDIIRSYASAIAGCRFDNGTITYTNDRYGIFGKAIGLDSQPGVNQDLPPGVQRRQLLVAQFFEILAQKVIYNPSVLDKAYQDTFPNQPQSRKLQLFYWAVRGERMPEPPAPLGLPAAAEKAGETPDSPANETAKAPPQDPG
jgi:hypothetical protein